MRKPRDIDAQLKALNDKTKALKECAPDLSTRADRRPFVYYTCRPDEIRWHRAVLGSRSFRPMDRATYYFESDIASSRITCEFGYARRRRGLLEELVVENAAKCLSYKSHLIGFNSAARRSVFIIQSKSCARAMAAASSSKSGARTRLCWVIQIG
jgi:hypothetical protein